MVSYNIVGIEISLFFVYLVINGRDIEGLIFFFVMVCK